MTSKTYGEYTTSIATCDPDISCSALIRMWHCPGSQLLLDNTCVFLFAKWFVPSNDSPVVLKPLYLYPFPGNPTDDDYQDRLPDFHVPVTVFTGTVLSTANNNVPLSYAQTKTFVVASSEFITGTVQSFSLRMCMDPTSPRWTKVPVPNVSNLVYAVGPICGFYNNTLHVDLSSVVLNLGGGANAAPSNGGGNGGSSLPTGRKRCFSALASTGLEPKKRRFEGLPIQPAFESAVDVLPGNLGTAAPPQPDAQCSTAGEITVTAGSLLINDAASDITAKVRGKRKEKL
ncbi:hypothetical protein D9758_013532 [Tetrapyrgos nigripes]|uniref:Uncharacterized protein n=1 Tax=Tetrapyrgos nigripes TaxID=182062 RepID=A0A8H5FWM4_9AGAR|nr:hypothetical protein D9758_013532 [Tetrapyrgos nigripes]